jgi:hypothetical protein
MRILTVAFSGFFLLFVLAQTTTALCGENPTPGVKLELSTVPEKQEYRIGEVVKLVFTLRNAGDRDVLVAQHFVLEEYVWVEILGPDGKELPWCGKIDGRAERRDEFAILRPGASVRSAVRVSCDAHRDSGFMLDRAGTCTLSAYYHLPYPVDSLQRIAGKAGVTTDRIRAKPISIVVRPAVPGGQ